MQLCPTCGNPYEGSVKYCPCCGAAIGQMSPANPEDTTFLYCMEEPATEIKSPAGAVSNDVMPAVRCPAPDIVPTQPIWLSQSPDSKAFEDIEEELEALPDADDYKSPGISAPFKPSEEDIFDEAANTASELFANMSPRAKRMVLSIIIGTLLSLISFLYTSCTHSDLIKTIFP